MKNKLFQILSKYKLSATSLQDSCPVTNVVKSDKILVGDGWKKKLCSVNTTWSGLYWQVIR